jgi:hypothetical protein
MNSFDKINPALIDTPSPEIANSPDGMSGYVDDGGNTRDVLKSVCGTAVREFPKSWWIEPKDWADKARDNDKYHTWGLNYVDRFTNQDPTHECTCHSLRTNFEAARNRQLGIIFPEGPKKNYRYEESKKGSVFVSPLSIYAEANPRQWGGANVREVLEIAFKRGFLPEKIQPKDYGFKHTLQGTTGRGNNNQSSGDWVPLSRFPEGWKETAANFRPLEIIFPDTWEQYICLLLHGCIVSVGRDGHAVPQAQLTFDGDTVQTAPYIDSYDVVRYDSLRTIKRCVDEAFAIVSTTTPDDWNKPAE